MKDLGKALQAKTELIVENWIQAVHQDAEIVTAKRLAHEAVRNSLPGVLTEIGKLLSPQDCGDRQKTAEKGCYHGLVRAEQGYDAAEIIREYRLLRQVITLELEDKLLSGTAQEVLIAVRAINHVLDEVITDSLEKYVEARLAELDRMYSQLSLINQELQRLVEAQEENLSFLAHELRTPLNTILGHSNLLLSKYRQTGSDHNSNTDLTQLEYVISNGQRILKIINNALEISRYNSGTMQLDLRPMIVGAVVQDIIRDGLNTLAAAKGLELVVDVTRAPSQVVSDALRIQQIVTNLVSNSIRYTETGSIQVVCAAVEATTPPQWELVVADTGVGISPELQQEIFQPYVRAELESSSTSTIADGGGTGLGLAIVQQIVTLLEGTITLDSTVGKGTVFTIHLPVDPTAR